VGKFNAGEVTIGWIGNSLEIGHLALSTNLRAEIEKRDDLEILGEEWDLPFDEHGNFQKILQHKKLRDLAGLPDTADSSH
jgi:hypothetical protein